MTLSGSEGSSNSKISSLEIVNTLSKYHTFSKSWISETELEHKLTALPLNTIFTYNSQNLEAWTSSVISCLEQTRLANTSQSSLLIYI